MDDWREVEAVWQEGLNFRGQDRKGDLLVMSGSGSGFSPIELLLLGLAGCTGVDVASILQKKRQKLTGIQVKVRGLRRDEVPKVFTQIYVEYVFKGKELDSKAIEQAIDLSEGKYCSVSVMLGKTAVIHSTYTIEPD